MKFEEAFTFPFQDPDWAKKILIPALIAIIPVLGQIFLLGFSLDVTRRILRHDPRPLPDLDFGRQFIDGLKGTVVALVYAIPIIIATVPISIVSASAGGNGNVDAGSNWMIAIVSICCGGLIVLYSILMAFILPAALANMVANERLSAALQFSQVFDLVRKAPGAYLLVLVGMLLTGIIGSLGTIACGIGVVVTTAYAMAVNGHLYGQAYHEARQNAGLAHV